MIDLEGQVLLVTGGSRGIGRAVCELGARAGAKIALAYAVETPSADAVVRDIVAAGGEAFALAADISVREEAEMVVDETVDRYGRISVLVNNAGIWRGAPIEEISDGEWKEMLGVNLDGAFHTIRAAVPHMRRAGGGRIVNVSSTAGQRGEALHAHYAATKGALIALTKSLAVELADDGILTNCVAPGWIETDMTRETLASAAGADAIAGIPLGRAGTPEEVAGVILFLASGLATFVNGEVINVNGGSVLCG